jgi:proteasome component ECM29
LLPVIIHGLAQDYGKPTCATVFNLFLRLLPRLKIPLRGSTEDAELRSKLGLDTHNDDAEFIASWIAKLLLLHNVRAQSSGTAPLHLGLSNDEYAFLTLNGKNEAWDPSAPEGLNLTEIKIICLSFIASGAFTDTERFLSALYASADSNSRISNVGDDLLKRTTVSLEEPSRISQLFDLYFELKPALKTRILSILSKSAIATTFPQNITKMVQQGLKPSENTITPTAGLEALKFRNAMFNFINWVARMGSPADLGQVARPLVDLLRGYIEEQGWPIPNEKTADAESLRALAYETLGLMAKTTPSLVREPELGLVRWLFRSLTEEGSSNDIFVSIEGALGSLINAFEPPLEGPIAESLRKLLLDYMTVVEDETIIRSARFAAVRWANRCLSYSDIVARWIDVLALGGRLDERSDVVEEGKKGLVCLARESHEPSANVL